MSWHIWLMVSGIAFLAIISPGPDFAIVVKNALAHGRRAGLWTAAGISAGLSVHVAYTVLGLGLIISQSIIAFTIVKWLGAGYLLWLGWHALRSKPIVLESAPEITIEGRPLSGREAFISGFVTNVLNPKTTLFFLALFTQILQPDTVLVAKLVYGLTIMVMALVVFSAIAMGFSRGNVRRVYRRIAHWIDRALGVAFVALGIKLAFTRQ